MAPRDLGIYPEVQTRPDVALDERPDLAKPSLEGLAWLLRHPEEWPLGHTWDFGVHLRRHACGTAGCALGIARRLWPEVVSSSHMISGDRTMKDRYRIFLHLSESERVTPSVVAGRIDDYLAGRPIRYLVAGDRSAAHAVPE